MGKLSFAEGKMPHPNGTISIKLTKAGLAGVNAEITLPEKTSGVFVWNGEKIVLHEGKQTANR